MKHFFCVLIFLSSSALIFCTQVSGNQSGTWTPANNPYEIVGDITIPSGQTLTLNPGVIVRAMGLYQIIAQGNIIANGTEADSIYFVSGQADPAALWDGIRLENASVQSQFSYCRIDLADYGINSVNSPVSVTFCHFKNNKRGIQAFGIGSANPATVLIDHNLIELTVQNAIMVVQNSNTAITNNEITRNGTSPSYYGAIQLSNQSAGGSCSPVIAYNHIHHNFKQGIIAWDLVSANAINPEVHHNLVENNLSGIYFRHSSGYLHHNTVINNFIAGDMNSGAGFMISGNTAQPYLEDNIVTGNYTGFYLTENAVPCLGNLAINHIWAQGNNTITGNIDADNVLHSIFCYNYSNGNITIYAENNIWDYNTADQIATTIEDHNDNSALPLVDFDPWQNNATAIYLTGTVTLANPLVPTATLELVSAASGLVLNNWTVNINAPFQVPVYIDSLVYVVAHTTDLTGDQYYGAYGGTDNPTALQLIANVQVNIGEIALSTPAPNWDYLQTGSPQNVNGHLCYPLKKGWFVYQTQEIFWLFREGDFLKLSRLTVYDNGNYTTIDPDTPPIWRRIAWTDSTLSWNEYSGYSLQNLSILTETAVGFREITTFEHQTGTLYDKINVGSGKIELYDYFEHQWHFYDVFPDPTYAVEHYTEQPIAVIADGTMFPLAENNEWHLLSAAVDLPPSYFGYHITNDQLNFYWIPTGSSNSSASYHLYDNNILLQTIALQNHQCSTPIPPAPSVHQYTLSLYNENTQTDLWCPYGIPLTFTDNEEQVLPTLQFRLYPNPFRPQTALLNIEFDPAKFPPSKIAVYNLKGQLVRTVQPDKNASKAFWDGKNNAGASCSAGIYTIVLTSNTGKKLIRQLLLLS